MTSTGYAQDSPDVVFEKRSFTDVSRSIKKAFKFPGTPDRRIDVSVWYPAGAAGQGAHSLPLIIYSHGTYGYASNASHFVNHLVRHGYVVAAPTFPLTSRESFTGIPMAVGTDAPNQPKDVSFVIDQLLADPELGAIIDPEEIGVVGHSLGAVTGYFLNYGAQLRDPRIGANAMIGAGDPVQAVLAFGFGFVGVQHAPVAVPALFLSAQHDVFASLTGRPFAAYSRVEPPKQEVLIAGGTHVWFRDGDDKHPDGLNPDCLFFARSAPAMQVPGCQQPVDLIEPQVQREITRTALLDFFNAYLKHDKKALYSLQHIDDRFPAAEIRFENSR
ncbi:alpha/beta hydrolase family protein [Haliea sp. E17]|uniref:alpha/beta hydrolase family protein n=1 Tax=Haliea sp. E17 TaxID=3401576 RepID=UPI003AAAC9DF